MNNTQEKINVMEDFDRGKTIRCTLRNNLHSIILKKSNGDEPTWDWSAYIYTVINDPITLKGFMFLHSSSSTVNRIFYYNKEHKDMVNVLITEIL